MDVGQEEAGMTNTIFNHYHHYYDQVGPAGTARN
jgi:hypothetical protein